LADKPGVKAIVRSDRDRGGKRTKKKGRKRIPVRAPEHAPSLFAEMEGES
jgi:hypothetical protein